MKTKFKVTIESFVEDPAENYSFNDGPIVQASAEGNGIFPSLEWLANFIVQARAGMADAIDSVEDE